MKGRIAETEVCDSAVCTVSHHLVRGDHIEFVSVEQVRRVGRHPLDDSAMPSDIKLPKSYVLVDPDGTFFPRCNFYVVQWHGGSGTLNDVGQKDIKIAHDYFGPKAAIRVGQIEMPEVEGTWKRQAKVQFIRYRRQGKLSANYEHEYNPPVFLYSTHKGPLAWKLALPSGCIVDSRGFVRP